MFATSFFQSKVLPCFPKIRLKCMAFSGFQDSAESELRKVAANLSYPCLKESTHRASRVASCLEKSPLSAFLPTLFSPFSPPASLDSLTPFPFRLALPVPHTPLIPTPRGLLSPSTSRRELLRPASSQAVLLKLFASSLDTPGP